MFTIVAVITWSANTVNHMFLPLIHSHWLNEKSLSSYQVHIVFLYNFVKKSHDFSSVALNWTGFVAQNITRNVTLNVNTVVLLMSVNGWLTILAHIDSNFPDRQPDTAYTSGFGDITSNFWLGLENVYYLTNTGVNGRCSYRLRFEILTSTNTFVSTSKNHCITFNICIQVTYFVLRKFSVVNACLQHYLPRLLNF